MPAQKAVHDARDAFLAELGARVRQERLRKRFSQRELAIAADYDEISMSKLENGQREIGVYALARIALALNVPIGILVGDVTPPRLDLPGPPEDEVGLLRQELAATNLRLAEAFEAIAALRAALPQPGTRRQPS